LVASFFTFLVDVPWSDIEQKLTFSTLSVIFQKLVLLVTRFLEKKRFSVTLLAADPAL